jgi:hypothetical protein
VNLRLLNRGRMPSWKWGECLANGSFVVRKLGRQVFGSRQRIGAIEEPLRSILKGEFCVKAF